MKLQLLALASLALPSLAHARAVTIETDAFSYPSPATVHFNALQDELARKAIEACGGEKKVAGIRNIRITVSPGIDDSANVAAIEKGRFGYTLTFNYPKIQSTAVVNCLE